MGAPKKGSAAAESPKRDRFVEEYCKDWNATQAAIRAGYSLRSASSQAFELLQKPEIKQQISAYLATLSANAHRITGEFISAAFSDMADYYRLGDDGDLQLRPLAELTPGQTRAIKKIKTRRRILSGEGNDAILEETTELELHDKLKALEQLAKLAQVEGSQPTVVVELSEKSTDEDCLRAIKQITQG